MNTVPMYSRAAGPAPTSSEAFKRWFGDSKVVDEQGKPLVVYHGRSAGSKLVEPQEKAVLLKEVRDLEAKIQEVAGPRYISGVKDERGLTKDHWTGHPDYERLLDFKEQISAMKMEFQAEDSDLDGKNFDPFRSNDLGVHFTASTSVASKFATGGYGVRGAVFPVYLKGDVVRIPDIFSRYQGLSTALDELVEAGVLRPNSAEKLRSNAEKLDAKNFEDQRDWGSSKGVVSFWKKLNSVLVRELENTVLVYENEVEGGGDSYVAFRPEQIKSATGNDGSFDPANPDIRFSRTEQEVSQVEALFKGLDAKGMTKKEALAALEGNPDADAIRFVEDNFRDLLSEIEDSGKVNIKC
jgi:hypothetical protein